jgi:carboxymethylenebutenolidase
MALLCALVLSSWSIAEGGTGAELLSGPEGSPPVYGVLELPRGPGPHPAVILLHGARGWDARYPRLARAFADSGFATLALDYYAEAGYSAIGSDEKLEKWPLYQAAVRSAVRYMHTSPVVAEGSVALVGFSRGAFLAVSVASSLPAVRAVVDLYGGGGGGTQELEHEVPGLPPLLILHGDADRIVPVRYAHELGSAVTGAGGVVEMHIYAGEGHGLSKATMPDAIRRTVEFLRRHLAH